MRGRELGLTGQDLMLYQIGEVVQVGVLVERELASWVVETQREIGISAGPGEAIVGFEKLVNIARRLASRLPFHSADEKAWISEVFVDSLSAMRVRNRVVHDQWVSYDDGKVTRFGYFAARDGMEATEVHPGRGPGEHTHDEWELLRTRLWHCWYRLSSLRWVRRYPPTYDYFFDRIDDHYGMVRGEFFLGRDYLVPFSWSDLTQSEVDNWPRDADPPRSGHGG